MARSIRAFLQFRNSCGPPSTTVSLEMAMMLNGTSLQSDLTAKGRDWLVTSPSGAAGAPDFDEAGAFLAALDPDADGFVFGAHDDNKERVKALIAEAKTNGHAKPKTYESRCGSIEEADLRRWMEERQAAGWGITVSAQAMKAGRRLISKLAYIRVVFAEMDIGEPLRPWPLEPSIVVETSPGRYHVYWLTLAEAPITAEEFHGVMMCLVETYGSDPDAKDIARTMRLPGTWNLKPGRAPHLVKIVRQTGARYSGQELVAAFPPPPRPKPVAAAPRPKLNGHTPPGLERFGGEDGPLRAISPGNYGDWLRVGMAMHEESGGGGEGLALWNEWSAASDKWSPGVCEEKWKSFGSRRGVTGGTIFAMAAINGWRKPEQYRKASSGYSLDSAEDSAEPRRAAVAEPDMSIVRRNQMPAPPFPTEILGPSAADWVVKTARTKSAPIDYVATGLLVTTAAMLGPKRRVSPWDGWSEPSILWAALLGPPSANKSPATDCLRDAVRTIEQELNADWDSVKAKFETEKEHAAAHKSAWQDAVAKSIKSDKTPPELPEEANAPQQPTRRRLWIVDATTEKAARILAENPGGLLCFRDELAGLLGSFDKYGGAGGDRAFWIEAFGGRSYRYDRVRLDDSLDIPFCSVSILGAIQPDRLHSMLLSGDDDGLASRFLYAWPDVVPPRRPKEVADSLALVSALRRLSLISFDSVDGADPKPRTLLLKDDAADEFQGWWEREQWAAKEAATGQFASAVGKIDGIALRLAQVLEYLVWAWRQSNTPEPEHISLASVRNAIHLIETWVRPSLERVFSEASLPKPQRDAMVIGRWLLKQERQEINARSLRREAGFPGPKEPEPLDAALEIMADAGWLSAPPRESGAKGRGRKDYAVNPKIYDAERVQ
jgi:hypothetical protein